MARKNHATIAILFTLLLAAAMLLTLPADSAWAESVDKDSDNRVDKEEYLPGGSESVQAEEPITQSGVHADPATFEKNFVLTVDQKKYTITEIENAIALSTEPGMSDLEKYYEIGKWVNERVIYDSDFWNGGYNLDYYSHQWDAYGGIKKDEKSVCAGIAIFYSNMCHAADLPCKFVRLKPEVLDHTISYIPDINGNAYFADITENDFLMSTTACGFASSADRAFSDITKDAEDGSFEFKTDYGAYQGSNIKECWQNKVTFDKWYEEYALHKGTDKKFRTEYVEKGSGTSGTHYASYRDFDKYPAQPYASRASTGEAGAATGIWFLDDFYKKPTEARDMILNKELDAQFLNISGVKGNYDCATAEELVAAVNNDISIEYFPSVENEEVVAKAAGLTNIKDYTVAYDAHDEQTGEEVLTIQGAGDYQGACQIRVRMNSAIAKTAPARINGLVYNGNSQDLVKPGEPENGTMVYAVCKEGEKPASEDYTETIPAKTSAGKYDVWYKVNGDATHSDLPAQKLERAVRILPQDIDDGREAVLSKESLTYNGKVQKPTVRIAKLKEGTDFTVSWDKPSSKNVGIYTGLVNGAGNYGGTIAVEYKIKPKGTSLKGLKKGKKAITVKWKKQSAKMSKSYVTGYQILLATNSKFTKNKKLVTVKGYNKVSRKVTKLKGGTKYYVKVRTFKKLHGKKLCSPWSKSKTVKTGK